MIVLINVRLRGDATEIFFVLIERVMNFGIVDRADIQEVALWTQVRGRNIRPTAEWYEGLNARPSCH